MSRLVRITCLAFLFALPLAACGDDGGSADGDDTTDGDGGTDVPDANGTGIDAFDPDANPPGCNAGAAQCNDCIDNDQDGQIDGFDVECTGEIDNDEGSFGTGIPGDNMDLVNQDCFFDGNSGAGDDRCNRHVCCILNLTAQQCADGGYDSNFDPAQDCPPVSPDCAENCGAITPPGCDCFGCCTICDEQGCVDVYTNPAIAPDCTDEVIHDPNLCPPCTQVADCGEPCNDDPTDCILCPGQDESDLPPECTQQECPGGATVCDGDLDCGANEFCSNGCCIAIVD